MTLTTMIHKIIKKYPIYLVGSVLTKNKPRDIDLICVIPNKEFKEYFGLSHSKFMSEGKTGKWSKERYKWGNLSIMASKILSKRMKANVDFKFIPQKQYKEHK